MPGPPGSPVGRTPRRARRTDRPVMSATDGCHTNGGKYPSVACFLYYLRRNRLVVREARRRAKEGADAWTPRTSFDLRHERKWHEAAPRAGTNHHLERRAPLRGIEHRRRRPRHVRRRVDEPGVDGFMRMTPACYMPGIGLRLGGERWRDQPFLIVACRQARSRSRYVSARA